VRQQSSPLLREHSGRELSAAFTAGMVHGDGLMKSLVNGGEGVLQRQGR